MYEFYLILRQPQFRRRALFHWMFWTLATALGWALAGFSGLPIGQVVVAEGETRAILSVMLTMGIVGTLSGGMIGTTQWMYLRRRIKESNWWIPVTALGWGIGLPMALLLNMMTGLGLSAVLYGVVIGAVVGLGQWVFLKRWSPPAGRWIWVSAIAIPLGIALAGVIEDRFSVWSGEHWSQVRWYTAFSGGVAGLVVGLLTGTVLLVLLSRRGRNP